MLVGIGYLFVVTTTLDGATGPTLNFRDLMYNTPPAAAAEQPEGQEAEAQGATLLDQLTEIGAPGFFGSLFGWNAAILVGVLLLIGTVGKSAQFPLHTWLPDAMEGPTPVSAMIHAATMVSAGVYMVVRVFPLLSAGADFHDFDYNTTLVLMGLVGGFTALFASVLAVGQSDIKRILAYSTIAQLGFMVAALGVGAWVAAAFHLINHAFFKALLFMASGSVIHAMEHGEHHAREHAHAEEPDGLVMDYCAPPNDIQRMGGLIHRLPVTAITMAIGGLSLAGFPFITAGFWSKDEIISEAWHGSSGHYFPLIVLLLLLISAALTAFYTARMWFLTFWGRPRTEAAEHAGLGSLRQQWVIFWNKRPWSADYKLTQEPVSPRDRLSFNQMELPLVILAFFAITAGFIGIHEDILGSNPLHDFLAPTLLEHPEAIPFNVAPMLFSIIVAVGGLALGWWMYGRQPLRAGETDPAEKALGPGLWKALQNRFYIDVYYRRYLLRPMEWASVNIVINGIDRDTIDGVLDTIAETFTWLGEACKRFNTVVIDGFVDGIVSLIGDIASRGREMQAGKVQQYLLFVTLALLAIGTLLIIQAR
jgi:NADH-quinone oxidoreductase subunit L